LFGGFAPQVVDKVSLKHISKKVLKILREQYGRIVGSEPTARFVPKFRMNQNKENDND